MNIPSHYRMKERAMKEETGLTKDKPVRGKRESNTYWHTRLLTHSILGEHYRTPQANLNLLLDYLNEKSLLNIKDFSFSVQGVSNLCFKTPNKSISFNAHTPIDKGDFLRAFGLRNQIDNQSF